MAHRTIGQESLAPDGTSRSGAALGRLSSLIDWQPVCALLAPLYPSAKGEPAWPPRRILLPHSRQPSWASRATPAPTMRSIWRSGTR